MCISCLQPAVILEVNSVQSSLFISLPFTQSSSPNSRVQRRLASEFAVPRDLGPHSFPKVMPCIPSCPLGLLLRPGGSANTSQVCTRAGLRPGSPGAFLPQSSESRVDPRSTLSTQSTAAPPAFRYPEQGTQVLMMPSLKGWAGRIQQPH